MSNLDKTGYNKVNWRPVGNQIALLLSNDDLIALESKNAKKSGIAKPPKKTILQTADGKPKIFTGKEEEEAKEAAKNNRTFTVAAVSLSIAEKEDTPAVGDEISLLAGAMTEVVVDDVVYGVIPIHRVLGIHKEKINPSLD